MIASYYDDDYDFIMMEEVYVVWEEAPVPQRDARRANSGSAPVIVIALLFGGAALALGLI